MAESRALRASTLFVLLSSGSGYSPFPSARPTARPLHGHRQCTRCDVHDRTVVSLCVVSHLFQTGGPCCCIITYILAWYIQLVSATRVDNPMPWNRRFSVCSRSSTPEVGCGWGCSGCRGRLLARKTFRLAVVVYCCNLLLL